MAMRGMRAAWAVAAVLGCGCAMVLGVDPDKYELVCQPGQVQCDGNTVQRCGDDGLWHDQTTCGVQTCVNGACKGCEPNAVRCAGNTPQSCDADGNWSGATACSSPLALCFEGSCIVSPPSCDGLPATCGPTGNDSCCAMTSVSGGQFDRDNNSTYPATVSGFRLDRFEITVGRFRAFWAAYNGTPPAADAGAHPLIMASGWNTMWDGSLPVDQATLTAAVKCDSTYQTWTDLVGMGANENLPMNCISWYEAFAFCAWDGGRLPTEAEWNYAAAGGDEQREYPWSNPPSSKTIDGSYAVYECTGDGSPAGSCALADILQVGAKSPKGDGKWGQADLAGSMWEWNLDWYENGYASTIQGNNCANIINGFSRVIRGGSWGFNASFLLSSYRGIRGPADRGFGVGARCARTL